MLKTRAVRAPGGWSITGEKVFITSGVRADTYTVAVRTGDGPGGLTLMLVRRGAPGLRVTPLDKMGWWCSDTAALQFDGVRVPDEDVIGDVGAGFRALMSNFNSEARARVVDN
jgi:acyl-CoA dehydrogenase